MILALEVTGTMEEEAYCNRCQETKPLIDFNRNGFYAEGRKVQVWCRPCAQSYDRIRDAVRGRVKQANVNARKLGLEATLTIEEWHEILAEYDNKCAYCPDEATQLDHYVPLSLGGPSIKSNIRPACQPCNMSKGSKHPDDWAGRSV